MLACIEFIIFPLLSHQFLMISEFKYLSVFDYRDFVCIADSASCIARSTQWCANHESG